MTNPLTVPTFLVFHPQLALALGLVACLEPDSERMVLKLLHRASQNGTAAIAAADEASRTVSASLESTLAGLVDGIQHLDCVAKKNCPKAAHADSIEPLEHEVAETDLRSREDLTENRTLVEVGVVKQMRARYVKQMQNVKAYRMDLEDKIKAHVASNEGLRKMIKGLKVEDEGAFASLMLPSAAAPAAVNRDKMVSGGDLRLTVTLRLSSPLLSTLFSHPPARCLQLPLPQKKLWKGPWQPALLSRRWRR